MVKETKTHSIETIQKSRKICKLGKDFYITYNNKIKCIIAERFSSQQWNAWYKQFVQGYLISDKNIGKKGQSYMVLRCQNKVRVAEVQRKLMIISGFAPMKIKICKNIKNCIQYCSSVDTRCVFDNIDLGWLNPKAFEYVTTQTLNESLRIKNDNSSNISQTNSNILTSTEESTQQQEDSYKSKVFSVVVKQELPEVNISWKLNQQNELVMEVKIKT